MAKHTGRGISREPRVRAALAPVRWFLYRRGWATVVLGAGGCVTPTPAPLPDANIPRAVTVYPLVPKEPVSGRNLGAARTTPPVQTTTGPGSGVVAASAVDADREPQSLIPIPKADAVPAQPAPLPLPVPKTAESPPVPKAAQQVQLPATQTPTDRQLPINLASALRLSDARPLVIAAAQTRVQIAAAQLERAKALWLPTVNVGSAYITHAGGNQVITGGLTTTGTGFLYGGASLEVRFAATDAIFEPLAARQEVRARKADVQAAKNNVLMATAEGYFSVQQARGTYSGLVDCVEKGRELVKRVEALSKGLAAPDEVERARALLADLEQAAAQSYQKWRVEGASLTRVLRLDPGSFVVPIEPDHLQVTLITPSETVDDLIPVGLTNRPELEANQAIVQATLVRLKQERLRPLIPSVLITGNGSPDFLYQAGVFGTGIGAGSLNQWAGRADVSVQLAWKLDHLGFGYQAKVNERQGQSQLAMIELYNVQDTIAEEVVKAKADLDSAAKRVAEAERGLTQSLETFKGNLKGMGQTTRFGDLLVLVNRPQEVTASLQQLQQAYANYFGTVADYNRAQFRLFHALGYPAGMLSCERPQQFGSVVPVDTSRPAYLPPVGAPAPCTNCPPR